MQWRQCSDRFSFLFCKQNLCGWKLLFGRARFQVVHLCVEASVLKLQNHTLFLHPSAQILRQVWSGPSFCLPSHGRSLQATMTVFISSSQGIRITIQPETNWKHLVTQPNKRIASSHCQQLVPRPQTGGIGLTVVWWALLFRWNTLLNGYIHWIVHWQQSQKSFFKEDTTNHTWRTCTERVESAKWNWSKVQDDEQHLSSSGLKRLAHASDWQYSWREIHSSFSCGYTQVHPTAPPLISVAVVEFHCTLCCDLTMRKITDLIWELFAISFF